MTAKRAFTSISIFLLVIYIAVSAAVAPASAPAHAPEPNFMTEELLTNANPLF